MHLKFSILGGSRSESLSQKGVAHLLSSAAFTGYSGPAAIKFFESLGAKIGTSVDREKVSSPVSRPSTLISDF